ncbi:helix-turn-helix domain-containing protein [Sinirhodobacter ferrireducens]|uniref:Helix-turn-helix domain-containing protein n=1 Tax=Paenirhodobacter ferrireducens TaxID=1215032 RepID=A0A443LGE6_9RHOB|nr:helix-turn-helix domain-containing protein [Sinirhodobacter ferrireducens]RWR48272.1 helix-turn-helix domain-containing protein [Sinirhodobacter ferrireducens]
MFVAGTALLTQSHSAEEQARALSDLDPARIDSVIVPGGARPGAPPESRAISSWLAKHHGSFSQVCSVCTGAFILASAGLLSGRRVTTHWNWTNELRRRCPEALVGLDPIYIEDGPIWTPAGVSAGIDMTLALIARDQGRHVAMAVARSLVVYMTRSGGQAQFSAPLEAQGGADTVFGELNGWILENLSERLDLEGLAARAGMSERTFRRRYREITGRSPMQAVDLFRVEAASQALVSGSRSIKQIARQVGCASESNLLHLFRRHYGVTPSEFRARFTPKNTSAAVRG